MSRKKSGQYSQIRSRGQNISDWHYKSLLVRKIRNGKLSKFSAKEVMHNDNTAKNKAFRSTIFV